MTGDVVGEGEGGGEKGGAQMFQICLREAMQVKYPIYLMIT